jgi:uncharacterized membrane protein
MLRRAAVGVAVVLLTVSAVALLPAGGATSGPEGTAPPLTTPEGFDTTTFEIRVYANGSTRWTIQHGRPLDNETEIERFREFASSFEDTDTEAFRNFRTRARRLTAFGTNATDRGMNATGFAREARVVELGQTRGVVELSFLWTNFARTDGSRVIVDDVFEGGMFVDAGQRLVVARGPDLAFDSVAPEPDSRSVEGNTTASETVTWFGQRQFADRRPRVVLVPPESGSGPSDSVSSDSASGSGTSTGTPTEATRSKRGIGMVPVVVAFVVLLGLGGGLAWYAGAFPHPRGPWGTSGDAAGTESVAASEADAVDSASPVPDEQLLSDEDRVIELLDEHGGRMKQVRIVEETDWSKSKVSMLLSKMEDEGRISKLRVGRENIISKAGEEPDAVGSPFDDE